MSTTSQDIMRQLLDSESYVGDEAIPPIAEEAAQCINDLEQDAMRFRALMHLLDLGRNGQSLPETSAVQMMNHGERCVEGRLVNSILLEWDDAIGLIEGLDRLVAQRKD